MARPGKAVRGLAATALLLAGAAQAHLMPVQQGTLNVVGAEVFAVVALPASAFPGADDDGDGRLSEAEVAAHRVALLAAVSEGLRLGDGEAPGRQELLLVEAAHDEAGAAPPAGLVALLEVRFPAPPRTLRLDTSLFGSALGARQLTVKASRDGEVEVAVLTPLRSGHEFFRGPGAVLLEATATGMEHILLGYDHLCFLLTILVAGAGWRAWLAMLTSFTAAHSLTLVLTLTGWLEVSPRLVEPAIAASILWMAVLNLRQGKDRAPASRVWIVFACGLLHGLGFAGSLTGLGLTGAHRALGLLGFNVGIELGQALFVLAVLAGGRALAGLAPRWGDGGLPAATAGRWASLAAAGLGAFWLLERLAGPALAG
jgi:hydrogenase/urease accessory protein HupE